MAINKSRLAILLVGLGFLALACGAFPSVPGLLDGRDKAPNGDTEESSLANGEKIYFTATNLDGETISYRGGPSFGGMMMGSYLTCAACHGPEARGGTHFMHMEVMDAPDIRYAALSAESGEHGEEEEHGEYDLEAFRLAVVEGQHPDGESLDRDMPRWQISDEDLADLFSFLKAIPE